MAVVAMAGCSLDPLGARDPLSGHDPLNGHLVDQGTRDAEKTDSESGEGGCENGATAASENQPEGAEQFGGGSFSDGHGTPLRLSV